MAIPVIYKGDDTDFNGSSLSVNLETDFDLDGCEVTLTLSGCKRSFKGLAGRAATLPLAFSSEETAGMPVGTHRATVSVYDSSGRKRTASDDIRIRVTDDLREAYGGADDQEIDVTIETGFDPTRIMEGETLKTNTPNSMRQAIKKIAQALGATVSALAVAALPVLGAEVQTAPFGDLDLDQNPSVVTNVTLDGLAMSSNTYTKAETDAKIVELAPVPGNFSVVSNRAMNASGNFLAVDGPWLWEAEKAIKLDNGYLEFDNTGTGGSVLNITYQGVIFDYFNSAYWQDIIDAANAHAAGDYTTPEDVTAAIREQSLGGIWDQQLRVWWTPVMSNGKLTYQATTNVNMNAESNP